MIALGGRINIFPILQMRGLKFRRIRAISHRHAAEEWQGQDLNVGSLAPSSYSLFFYIKKFNIMYIPSSLPF